MNSIIDTRRHLHLCIGGGATKYEAELRKIYGMDGTMRGSAGGFQQMTQDALTVLNDIPFSIPPYFALLGKDRLTEN